MTPRRHSDLHDLRFDLSKSRGKRLSSGAVRNEDAGRPYHGIDDISDAQRELLHAPINSRTNVGPVQIHLRFGHRRLRACPLRGKKSAHAAHRGLFRSRCGIKGALTAREQHLELFDVTLRDNAGIAFLEFALGVQLIRSPLVGSLCFLDLSIRLENIRLRRQQGGIDFGNLAPGRFQCCFPLCTVELEDHVTLLDGSADGSNVNFRHAAHCFRNDRDGPVE
jgi:hypothetical protein